MERQRKTEIYMLLLVAVQVIDKVRILHNGGLKMGGLTFAEIIQYVVDVGLTPVLLLLFIAFFIRKANDDDNRVKKAYADAQKKIEDCNREVRSREDTLMAESAKREEILRQEAEKRENLIRKEAEKRESILMTNQDRMLDSMNQISQSLQKIEISMSKMESRHETDINQIKDHMQNLEQKIDCIGG